MPLDLESLTIFVRVAELSSFTRAGEHLGVPKAKVSQRVQALEAEMGTRLLHRTTRAVHLTPDGEALLARARRLVADAEEVASMFQAPRHLRGTVRVDMPINLARNLVIPRLPELVERYPDLAIQLSTTDRRVDLARDGFDCVVRVGAVGDPSLHARRLGTLGMVNCASPGYLRARGVPRTLADLDRHVVVHYAQSFRGEQATFEAPDGAGGHRDIPMRCLVTVNNVDAYRAACVAGLGIIQVPRYGVAAHLAAGDLVEVLPTETAAPMPVSMVHAHGRSVPRRARVVMTWIAQVLTPHLADAPASPR